MRFHQSDGISQHNNGHNNFNEGNVTASVDNLSKNQLYISQTVQLEQLKSLLQLQNNENIEANTNSLNENNLTSNHLQYKADSAYFKSFIDSHSFIYNNGNDSSTSALTEENLTKFMTESAYENCTTNLSYLTAAQQRFLSNIQRRENLIKLDLATTNYMNNKNGTKKNSIDSAGSSNESSPMDNSYLEIDTSPAPSSSADLSSFAQLDVKRDYPRGIINPNYPGFQHLAHTLSDHFIDHHQYLEHSTDSEDDFEYESNDNLENNNAENMNDSNNNTNNAGAEIGRVRDLNCNQNLRNSSHNMHVDDKEEDSNRQFQTKVFCDRKLLNLQEMNRCDTKESLNDNLLALENISSSDEIDDEELDELESEHINHFDGPEKELLEVCEHSTRMEYDDDELDVSVEDDWAIKTELENIDKLSYDFESVNCDLETYLRRYDYPNDCKMFSSELIKEDIEEQIENFIHDSHSLTPDILLEHGNNKTNSDETSEVTKSAKEVAAENSSNLAINLDERSYQPDLIKNITDTIKINENIDEAARQFVEKIMSESDNENLTIMDDPSFKGQQTRSLELFLHNNKNVTNSQLDSFGEECAAASVDIVGDFGKEIEQEIGLIVSGYTSSTVSNHVNYLKSPVEACILDEQTFMEHIQNFSKMGDAVLSNVNDTINSKSTSSESNQLIPTAIVKPKYQKLAFDDRQLPIVGSTDNNDSPWFDASETASTITTTPRKVQKHLPNFDRRSQKPSFVKQQHKLMNKSDDKSTVNAVSVKEAINSVRYSEKDVDCSSISKNILNSVAIVQPQKKYEVHCLADKLNEKKTSITESFPSASEINLTKSEAFPNIKGAEIKSNNIVIKKREKKESTALFDVYNIETALPVIDLEAIETHLMAAKEEERKLLHVAQNYSSSRSSLNFNLQTNSNTM